MAQNLGNRSILTNNLTIFIYYACALLSLYFNMLALVAFLGSIISCVLARKENDAIIASHCSWVFRTYWLAAFLALLIIIAGISLVIYSNIPIPEYFEFTTFEQFWNDPYVSGIIYYIIGIIICLTMVTLWFIARMIRGIFTLLNARAPKNKF